MVFRAMAVLATLLLGVAAPRTAHAARDPDCPVEPDACEFVRSVVVALDSGDRSALLPLQATEEVVCPAPDSGGLGGPFPLCDGAAEGERRVGVPISRINSEGGMIAPEDVAGEVLPDFNGPRPGTIGCAETDPAEGLYCRDAVSLVFVPRPCPFDSPCSMLPFVILRAVRGADGAFAIRDVVVVPRALISSELVVGGVLEDRFGAFLLGGSGLVRFFLWEG